MTQEQVDQMLAYEKEIVDHNEKMIKCFGQDAEHYFEDLLWGCRIVEKIKFVDAPKGDDQDEEYGPFKEVHVDQWSIGDSGDSFEGYVYAKIDDRWIQIPYSC